MFISQTKTRRRLAVAFLLLLAVSLFAIVAIPVKLIMPFSPQTPRALSIAFELRRWSPTLTLIGAITALALVVWLWSNSRWWLRTILVIALAPVAIATWFARQNHFEWMFNPLPNPAYAKISNAGFVNDSDMVLAVENLGESVAYPIRLMAYHHLVKDTVGGTPIVATY